MIVFLLVKRFGMSMVHVFFSQEKIDSMRILHSTRRRNVNICIIYMIPVTPKDLINYYAGITDMRFSTWLLVCSVGRIPSIITSTITGDAFGQRRYAFGIIVTVATLVLGLLALLLYNTVIVKKDCAQGQ